MSSLYYNTGAEKTASDFARDIIQKAGCIRMADPNDRILLALYMLQIRDLAIKCLEHTGMHRIDFNG